MVKRARLVITVRIDDRFLAAGLLGLVAIVSITLLLLRK